MTDAETRAAIGFATVMGRPLKAHQRAMVADLSRRDGPGYVGQTAVVLMPRQVGKTSTLLALALARMHLRRGYAGAYSAQTGIVVTHVFANPDNGWLAQVERDPRLAGRFRTSRSQGREMIAHRTNTGAYLKAFPPTPGRLRSNSLDLVILDECQEHTPDLGQALMADIGPVFTTRPRRQLILAGTAGGPGWWADQIAAARAGKHMLIEVGSWPADADPADPAVWRRYHPGLRAGLTDEAHLTAQLVTLGESRFAREYGNRFDDAAALDSPIPDDVWAAAQVSGPPPEQPTVIGFDVGKDGESAAIVAAGHQEGKTVCGVAGIGHGTGWLVGEIRKIAARWPRARLVADPAGPAGPAVAALEGVRIHAHKDRATAAAALASSLAAGETLILAHPELDEARRVAVRRWTEQGGWSWSRRLSPGTIAPLTALTMTAWDARPTTRPKPRIVVSSDPAATVSL